MPPRAQKKPAAAKKPSPNPAAKPDPAPEAPAAAQAAEEVPAAPEPAPAAEEVTVEETVVTTEAVEEKVVVEEVAAEEAAPEEEVEPEEEEVEPEEEVDLMEEEEAAAENGDGADLAEDVKKVQQKAGAAVVGAGDNQPSGQTGSGDENNEDDEEEEDLSILLQPHFKETEIFVGKLDKEAVEDDLVKVFGVFGELQSVRIVKRPDTQKSKGFGFVRYVNTEHAKKALDELKDGVQIKGKEIRVSASDDNDTLYLGNINKLWSKDIVMNVLKELGVDQIKDIVLPDDQKKEGKTKGFALIEFGSHADAVAAFRRLRKPDAVFGCERSAKVAFSTSLHPTEENLSKVKSVYLEGLPESWDEDRVKEACNQYGEIAKVRLVKSRKKDFGFVDFCSHESAVACVKGFQKAQLGEGDIKFQVKANLAKPENKDRRQHYQEPRGGFLVKKHGEVTEEPLQTKKKEVSNRGKARSKGAKGSPASKSEGKTTPGKRRDRRGVDTLTNGRPSKKPRDTNYGSRHSRPANSFGNQRAIYMAHPTSYVPRYALPAPSYQAHAYAGPSGSNRRYSELEPHGGYLPAGRGAHYSQPSSGSGYTRAAGQPPYQGYPGYPGYEDPYGYPSSGAYPGYEDPYGYPSSGAYAPRRGYY